MMKIEEQATEIPVFFCHAVFGFTIIRACVKKNSGFPSQLKNVHHDI